MREDRAEAAVRLEEVIRSFVCDSPENHLGDGRGEKAWGDPLVGFSRGDDPLFEEFKDHVGPFHWTPLEAFSLGFPELRASAGELTVISWVLPQTKATIRDNARETFYPAERWARTRFYGEQFNDTLRRHVVTTLLAAGYATVAPTLLPGCVTRNSERYGYAAPWSERHAAYASGLGPFGLSDGLITAAGKAMRVGSVIVRLQVPPTPRPYLTHQAYCLYFINGSCGKCVERCPVQSISPTAGRNKDLCRKHVQATAAQVRTAYGFEGYGCGLCQTRVPCESGIPIRVK